jgi:hypothetical protein
MGVGERVMGGRGWCIWGGRKFRGWDGGDWFVEGDNGFVVRERVSFFLNVVPWSLSSAVSC